MHIHAYISTSAKQRTNLPQLCDLLVSCASLADTGGDIIVSNLRHYEALTRALEALRRVQSGLANAANKPNVLPSAGQPASE